MPDIYVTKDATLQKYGIFSWATARAAAVGSMNTISSGIYIHTLNTSGRGSIVTLLNRFFMEIDTSGISVAPASASLRLYGHNSAATSLIAVRSTLVAATDGGMTGDTYNDIYNSSTELAASDGSGAGTLAGVSGLTYSSATTSWSTSGYNTIPLNATALADIASVDKFKVCIMSYTYDYLDIISVGTDERSGLYTDAYTGTSRDPYLKYTAGTAVAADNSVFFGCNF